VKQYNELNSHAELEQQPGQMMKLERQMQQVQQQLHDGAVFQSVPVNFNSSV